MANNGFTRSARQAFGKRLYRLMLEKGWKQSDLARHAGILRDSVSNYIRGNHMPEALNLKKLADALHTTPENLLPDRMEQAIDLSDDTSLEIKSVQGDPRYVWIRLNRLVKSASLSKILDVINEASDYADPAESPHLES